MRAKRSSGTLTLGLAFVVGCGRSSGPSPEAARSEPIVARTETTAAAKPVRCGPASGRSVWPRSAEQPARLCIHATIASNGVRSADQKANVVMVWYRPEELSRFDGGLPPFELFDAFFERARVVEGVDLTAGDLELSLDYPGGDAAVFVVADVHRSFWATMFGAGAGNFIGVGKPASVVDEHTADATVTLSVVPTPPPKTEACAGERFELVEIDAPEVAGTVNNPTKRRACAYLPASYAKEPTRRYPVVYLLPGFGSSDLSYLGGKKSLRDTADALKSEGLDEVILVGVDTSTLEGSTYFTDSKSGGAWDAFFEKRLLVAIDKRLRTLADPRARALVGHSTGGFNAVSLALRHPTLFGAVASSAPDGLDIERWLVAEDGKIGPKWLAWTRLEAAVGGKGQFVSYASAWSSEGSAWPFDLETGALAPAWTSWRAASPVALLDDPKRLKAFRATFDGRIYLTVGKRDEFGLYEPTKRFSARLTELGVHHELVETEGGHGSDQWKGLEGGLRFVARAMSPKRPKAH
ncbi:MAG: hypothetical protein HOW73_05150 [Polyangiaceae bacterium]|nr:hypothetical protein [Polyangiaceae bacterium]